MNATQTKAVKMIHMWVNSATAKLADLEYIGVLETLITDFEASIDAKREEMRKEEEGR